MRFLLSLLICSSVALVGCSPSQQHNAAQASENAAIILQNLQQAEITAYNAGDIPASDHLFIEQSLTTIAQSGKAADACIASATSNSAVSACVITVVNTVSQINADGGTYLKSTTAKNDFTIAMTGVQSLMQAIVTMTGGSN